MAPSPRGPALSPPCARGPPGRGAGLHSRSRSRRRAQDPRLARVRALSPLSVTCRPPESQCGRSERVRTWRGHTRGVTRGSPAQTGAPASAPALGTQVLSLSNPSARLRDLQAHPEPEGRPGRSGSQLPPKLPSGVGRPPLVRHRTGPAAHPGVPSAGRRSSVGTSSSVTVAGRTGSLHSPSGHSPLADGERGGRARRQGAPASRHSPPAEPRGRHTQVQTLLFSAAGHVAPDTPRSRGPGGPVRPTPARGAPRACNAPAGQSLEGETRWFPRRKGPVPAGSPTI